MRRLQSHPYLKESQIGIREFFLKNWFGYTVYLSSVKKFEPIHYITPVLGIFQLNFFSKIISFYTVPVNFI